jgi:hypothetical protein
MTACGTPHAISNNQRELEYIVIHNIIVNTRLKMDEFGPFSRRVKGRLSPPILAAK